MDRTDPNAQRLAAHYLACVEAEDRRSLQLALDDAGRRFIAPWSGEEQFLHPNEDSIVCKPAPGRERDFMAKGTADPRGADMGFYGYPLWLDRRGRVSPLFIVPVAVEDLGGRGTDASYLLYRADRIILNRYLFGAFTGEELDEIQRELESDTFSSFAARLAAAMGHAHAAGFDAGQRAIEPLPVVSDGSRWVRTPIFLRDARGPFTFNLRQDLSALTRYRSVYEDAAGTALGLLWASAESTGQAAAGAGDVAELLPLNPSQSHAATAAYSNPLTVVTGPPGTGKSQVVVDLLASAILSNRPILFASKNNQAVDVVRLRLREALGEAMDFSIRAGNREAMEAMEPELLNRLSRLEKSGPAGDERKARARVKRAQRKLTTLEKKEPRDDDAWRQVKRALSEATRDLCRAVWGRRLHDEAPEVRRALKAYREALRQVGGRGSAFIASLDRLSEAQQALARYLPIWITTALSVRNAVPLRAGQFDLVVIDEASQCDIASAVPLLYRARRATVIGDPHQFRHIASIDEEIEAALPTGAGMLPAWSYVTHSLFDVAARAFAWAGHSEPLFLEEHYRSHPSIIAFSNDHFYDGRLTIRTDLDTLTRRLPGIDAGVYWLDVQGTVPETMRSAYNLEEIDAVLAHVAMLLANSGPETSIGVVTPFRAQIDRLKSRLREAEWYDVSDDRLRVGTSHTFQGDECDVVVFSPVVSTGIRRGAREWAATTNSLLNVAVTRARAALHIIGNRAACEDAGGALGALAQHARPMSV